MVSAAGVPPAGVTTGWVRAAQRRRRRGRPGRRRPGPGSGRRRRSGCRPARGRGRCCRARWARGTGSRCPGPAPSPRRWKSNQPATWSRRSAVTRSEAWESCPPAYQTTLTSVPFAAIPRALASACPRPNSESWVPWISRVGASIRSRTPAGLLRSSTAAISGVRVPVAAAVWYAAQMSARNRPQVRACSTAAGSSADVSRPETSARGAVAAAERVEQAAGGRGALAEEEAGPQPLVDAGVAVLGGRRRPSARRPRRPGRGRAPRSASSR